MSNYNSEKEYLTLYPDLDENIRAFLRKSDRKMEYFERDLKHEHCKQGKNGREGVYLPSREDSLERLFETDKQFSSLEESVVEIVEKKLLIKQMMACLQELPEAEHDLIWAVFFEGKSQTNLAAELGVSQPTIHNQLKKALSLLKKMMKI